MKPIIQKILPHIVAVLAFIVLSSMFFSPLFGDKQLRQGDIAHFRGMAQEIVDFREEYGEEPLWSNSMFSGMPAYQISVRYTQNLLRYVDQALLLGLPRPVGYLMMCMLGFYILFQCLRINPWISIPFAVIAGFSTIHILYIGAGHMSKVRAISFMAPYIGGLIYTFRRDIIKGGIIAAFFLAMHVYSNHLQMTYYLLFLTAFISIGEIIRLIRKKETSRLPKILGVLVFSALIAVLPSINSMYNTYNYGKYTMRGDSKLTIQPKGKEQTKKNVKGLEKDYILQYSLGEGEVLSMLVPNVKGGASAGSMAGSKEAMDAMKQDTSYQQIYNGLSNYWGEQSFTAGAFYFGAFFAALFLIALFASNDQIKWPLLAFTVLASILSMKYAGLTDTFIDSFPMFSKFRDTKMMLVGVSICFPLLGAIFTQELIDGKVEFKGNKILYAGLGVTSILFLVLAFSPSSVLDFFSKQENQMLGGYISQGGPQGEMIALAKLEVAKGRAAVVSADAKRSLLFVVVAISMVIAILNMKAKALIFALVAGLIGIVDVWGVNKRYLNHDDDRSMARYYENEQDNAYPNKVGAADMSIITKELRANPDLKKEIESKLSDYKSNNENHSREAQAEISFGHLRLNTNYRVLNLGNTFNDARTSHYHKSIGGYHGGKLGAYQDLIDFKISSEISSVMGGLRAGVNPDSIFKSTPVLNMLNTKYAIYSPESPALENPSRLGNAWLSSNHEYYASSDELMTKLAYGGFDPRTSTLLLENKKEDFKALSQASVKANEVIRMTAYKQNEIEYEVESNYKRLAVFSEVYFADGWKAYINDQEVEIHEVNYILRAVKVPQGSSKVKFKFEPEMFSVLNVISLISSALVLLLMLFFVVRNFK